MKILKYLLILLFLGLLGFAGYYFVTSNNKPPVTYETEKAFYTSIESKTLATGKIVPEEEIDVKPQVSGIVDKIYVKEGQQVSRGTLIAKIRVVPDEQSLNATQGRINNAKINVNNAKIEYDRSLLMREKGVTSEQELVNAKFQYEQAQQELKNAESDLLIIKQGSAGGQKAITNIRAQNSGTILQIPVEEGNQVIQSNNFNEGTTIATIADLSKMIFEGKVDESEVGKLEVGMPLEISLGAYQKKKLTARLRFIAPKGLEEQGAVQFKIEGDLEMDQDFALRAGYSANASMVLERKDSVLAIREALLQFDKETNEPYVEIEKGEQEFEKREVSLGISDGLNIEIIEGLDSSDLIKIWNQTVPVKIGDEDEENDEE